MAQLLLLIIALDNAIHSVRALFGLLFVYRKHLERYRAIAESYLDDISDVNLFGGLCDPAVDFYSSAVAGFLCYRSALYDARNFQILIDSHIFYLIFGAICLLKLFYSLPRYAI